MLPSQTMITIVRRINSWLRCGHKMCSPLARACA